MRTKISFHRNENKYIKKFAWLKVASVDCELLLIAPFLLVSSKDVYQLRSINRTIYKQTRVGNKKKITAVFVFQLLQFDYEV
jgi:lipopolysaccharide/colanic/teichoic acid biosynthesis glycosyltransferase